MTIHFPPALFGGSFFVVVVNIVTDSEQRHVNGLSGEHIHFDGLRTDTL